MADKKVLVLSAQQLALSHDKESMTVFMRLDLAQTSAELMPDYEFAIGMSPIEARQIAAALVRMADAVEAGVPRA